jgi:glycosyltransferase involved in cell wall biosynthesis
MRPLRFCMVTTFYPPYNFGGDGVGVQRLARGLVRRGHRVTVIHDVDAYRVLSGRREPEGETQPDGVEVVSLRSGIGAISPLLTQQTGRPVANGRAIRRILDGGRFDVINFHNVSLMGGPGVLSAGGALKLYTAHEHWLVCPTHVLWRHRREPCAGRECLRCTLRHRRPPQLWRYTGYLERQLRHVDAFIAMSDFSREKHYEFGFPRRMEVLPDLAPSDDGDGRVAEPARPQERAYFLFVGRLERLKGLDDVIPVFRAYEDADLLIAGDGGHAPALRTLAGGNPRVRFLGRLEHDQLVPYLSHAVALIVPSVCWETFGITAIEAFRYGTPVIARRIGPLPATVELSGGGELFDGPGELMDAMSRIQGDPALRRALGEAAYEGFREHWSETALIPRYLEIIRRTAGAAGRTELAQAIAEGAPPPAAAGSTGTAEHG